MAKLHTISTALFRLLTISHFPYEGVISCEVAHFATNNNNILAVISFDYTDKDFNIILMGRDRQRRYRSFQVFCSFSTIEDAIKKTKDEVAKIPDTQDEFYQGDEKRCFDVYRVVKNAKALHPFFSSLNMPQHSPAKEVVREIAYVFKDKDGNFIEQFQTAGFNARLFELYIFAYLHESQFIIDEKSSYPDFVFAKGKINFALECTTVNPGKNDITSIPDDPEILKKLVATYFPVKFGSSLFTKLNHRYKPDKKRYWELPQVNGKPLIFAIEDFHLNGSMCCSHPGLERYLYGYDYEIAYGKNGNLRPKPQKIDSFIWKTKRLEESFFDLADAENISAVLFTNSATISKFNRMGKIAGFGDANIRLIREGARYDHDPNATMPIPFMFEINENTKESWGEGLVMYHNPRAKIAINRNDFPDIAHMFLDENNLLRSFMPKFHPFTSTTHAIA